MKTRTRNLLGQLLTLHIPLVPFILFSLFPSYFMVITSFKADGELYNLKANPFIIQLSPTHPDYSGGPTLEHYQLLLYNTPFLTWLFNSVLVSVLATAISIVTAILAAYSLARLRFRGAPSFGTAVFITYLVPTTLLFLPLAQVVNRLGLADSVWALIVTYPTFLVPFCTWLLLGYFRTIPQEIEECQVGKTSDEASKSQKECRKTKRGKAFGGEGTSSTGLIASSDGFATNASSAEPAGRGRSVGQAQNEGQGLRA